MNFDYKPAPKKKRLPNIDPRTYGGTPAAVFLADMFNTAIENAEPDIGKLVRKYGKLYENFNSVCNEIADGFEMGYLSTSAALLVQLLWDQTSATMTKLALEMRHLDQRIPNLCRNVLAGQHKTFNRAYIGFTKAKQRQQTWLTRIKAGKDVDDDVTEDGVLLIEDGMPVQLYFEHFYEDRNEVMDKLWANARNVTRT